MTRNEPGLLRTSFCFVKQALNEDALLRISVLATVLCITLACIALASFGATYTLAPKDGPQSYSPRLFGLLFLPAEFLIYDLILGNPRPRIALSDLYLDWRLPRLFWATLKMFGVVFVPAALAGLLLVGVTAGFGKGGKPSGLAVLAIVAGCLALFGAVLYYTFRFFYLSIVVARRDQRPLRTAFGETKGRIWRIGCALFLPYLAILAVTVPMELLGPVLERRLGFVGLAPWFLFDAGLTGFMCCLGAAVLAFSYQRIILNEAGPEPARAEYAPGQGQALAEPQDGKDTGGAG